MRAIIKLFGETMEKYLEKNDHKIDWSEQSETELFEHLKLEIAELSEVINGPDLDKLENECCDVALLAMMIWNNALFGNTPSNRGRDV